MIFNVATKFENFAFDDNAIVFVRRFALQQFRSFLNLTFVMAYRVYQSCTCSVILATGYSYLNCCLGFGSSSFLIPV